jgi:hypothetical protein
VPPHRHDYHELIWVRRGLGRHMVDGERFEAGPHTLTLIRRGQVHAFERAMDVDAAVIRFGDELLYEGPARANPSWLVGATALRALTVPDAEVHRVETIVDALVAETRRRFDACSVDPLPSPALHAAVVGGAMLRRVTRPGPVKRRRRCRAVSPAASAHCRNAERGHADGVDHAEHDVSGEPGPSRRSRRGEPARASRSRLRSRTAPARPRSTTLGSCSRSAIAPDSNASTGLAARRAPGLDELEASALVAASRLH